MKLTEIQVREMKEWFEKHPQCEVSLTEPHLQRIRIKLIPLPIEEAKTVFYIPLELMDEHFENQSGAV